jgi:hypothetical protein
MTRRTLSMRDWEKCSAYLDGQLTEKQTALFKLELERKPELRQALDEMRRTKLVLNSAARLHAPRNFTLSPEMAWKRLSAAAKINLDSLFPIFRFSSVAASLLFVFVVITNLFWGGITRRSASMLFNPAAEKAVLEAPAPNQVQATMAVEALDQPIQPPAEMMAKEMEQPTNADPLSQEPSYDLGGGMGEGGEAPAVLTQPGIDSSAIYGDATQETQQVPTTTSMVITEELRQPYPSLLQPTIAALEEAESLQDNVLLVRDEKRISWWLVVEISLATIGLVSGIGAILIKRRKA